MSGISASPANPDEQAIRGVVAEYGAAWNRHDMDAMANSSPTMPIGSTSSAGIGPARRRSLPVTRRSIARFFQKTAIELVAVEIRAIAPEVATALVLLKVGASTPPDGVRRPESEDRLSLVLTKRDGRWRITHGHNTVIDPGAKPIDPWARQ